jgi:hypothetical protein
MLFLIIYTFSNFKIAAQHRDIAMLNPALGVVLFAPF